MGPIIQSLTLHPRLWIQPALVFAGTLAVTYIVRRIFFRALRAWAKRAQSRAGVILAEALRGPTLIWNLILATHFAIQSSELPGRVTHREPELLQILFIVSLTLMFIRLAGDLTRHLGNQIPGAQPVTSLTKNLAQILVVLIGILLVLNAMDVKITAILTALGVGGLAVALALQDTLSNLFAGFYITVAGQLRLGDYIKLNTGEEGYVTDISWRSTAMRGLGNNMIIVPNAKLAQANVTNYYLPDKRMASSVQVGVSYASDPENIERILLDVGKQGAGEIAGMLAEPAPFVLFDPGSGDSALGFTLNYHIAEFANQYSVRHELRKRIFRRFKQEGIEIPFPTRTLHVEGKLP